MVNPHNDGTSALAVFLMSVIVACFLVMVTTCSVKPRDEQTLAEFCKSADYISSRWKREECLVYWVRQVAEDKK